MMRSPSLSLLLILLLSARSCLAAVPGIRGAKEEGGGSIGRSLSTNGGGGGQRQHMKNHRKRRNNNNGNNGGGMGRRKRNRRRGRGQRANRKRNMKGGMGGKKGRGNDRGNDRVRNQSGGGGRSKQLTRSGGEQELRGYWLKTWNTEERSDVNMEIAFSGWADVDNAIRDSRDKKLTGTPYFGIGGSDDQHNGWFTSSNLSKLNDAIKNGSLRAYKGIAYDIEEGDAGLASSFSNSFAIAKQNGFKVLIGVSHSAPHNIADKNTLMDSFLKDDNIDYISPMLYSGNPTITHNEYAPTYGYPFTNFKNSKAAIVPSITHADQYEDAKEHFANNFGIQTEGYLVYN